MESLAKFETICNLMSGCLCRTSSVRSALKRSFETSSPLHHLTAVDGSLTRTLHAAICYVCFQHGVPHWCDEFVTFALATYTSSSSKKAPKADVDLAIVSQKLFFSFGCSFLLGMDTVYLVCLWPRLLLWETLFCNCIVCRLDGKVVRPSR